MNPMMRAMAAQLAKTVPALSGVGAMVSVLDMPTYGAGELMQKSPDGRSWEDVLRRAPSPNARVADGFNALTRGDRTQLAPVDRIKQAFDAINGSNLVPANSPGVYGPDAVMTGGPAAPGTNPMNLRQHQMVTVPDRVPVMAQGGSDDPSPIGFFLRNALAQRDRESGDYLNPEVGAQAMASPFKGLFRT